MDLLSKFHKFDYLEMAKDITSYVQRNLNIEFKDDHHLLIDLCTHLKSAVNRCKFNMPLANPCFEDIKNNYYMFFSAVQEAFLMLKIKYPFEINDHELSYIVLHFAAQIEKEKVLYNQCLKVLLICTSGIGTTKMLFNRLTVNFKEINVVNIISYLEFLKKEDWNVDLVISTINIKPGKVPCIVVNPLLNEDDHIKISEYLFANAFKKNKEHSQFPSICNSENDLTENKISNNVTNQDNSQISDLIRETELFIFLSQATASLSNLEPPIISD